MHGIAATPTPLLRCLSDWAVEQQLDNITLHHMHLEGETPWTAENVKHRVRSNSLFTGHNLRSAVNDGTTDFNSIFLHELPKLFKTGTIKLNMALLTVGELI